MDKTFEKFTTNWITNYIKNIEISLSNSKTRETFYWMIPTWENGLQLAKQELENRNN